MSGRAIITAVVVAAVLVSAVAGSAGAQSDTPESADELLNELNDLRESEALSAFTEFDLARSQAVVELQTGDDITDDERERMQQLLLALQSFETAFELSAEDPVESLEHADQTATHLEALSESGGDSYAALGTVALERFYAAQADELYDRAQRADATDERLELLAAAADAYEGAGQADRYSEVQIEHDELESRYVSDMDRHDELIEEGAAYAADCGAACEGVGVYLSTFPVAEFGEYPAAMNAHESATEAERLAAEHGVEDRSEAAPLAEATLTGMTATAVASVVTVVAYALLAIAAGWVVLWRLSRWARDVRAAARAEIVAPLEVDNV